MTATTRCSFQKYIFPECTDSRILMDLLFPTEWDYGFSVKEATIEQVSDTRIEGYAKCVSGAWSRWNDWTLYFSIRFSKPFDSFNGLERHGSNREYKQNFRFGRNGSLRDLQDSRE